MIIRTTLFRLLLASMSSFMQSSCGRRGRLLPVECDALFLPLHLRMKPLDHMRPHTRPNDPYEAGFQLDLCELVPTP